MFVPTGSLLEEVVRGTIIYLALFSMLRATFRRELGTPAMSDLLLLVLLADAAQNGVAGDYLSVTEGVVLVGTIVVWAFGMDAAAYR